MQVCKTLSSPGKLVGWLQGPNALAFSESADSDMAIAMAFVAELNDPRMVGKLPARDRDSMIHKVKQHNLERRVDPALNPWAASQSAQAQGAAAAAAAKVKEDRVQGSTKGLAAASSSAAAAKVDKGKGKSLPVAPEGQTMTSGPGAEAAVGSSAASTAEAKTNQVFGFLHIQHIIDSFAQWWNI